MQGSIEGRCATRFPTYVLPQIYDLGQWSSALAEMCKGKRSRSVCSVVQQEEVKSTPASSYECIMVHCVLRRHKLACKRKHGREPAIHLAPSLMLAGNEFQSLGRAIVKEDEYEERNGATCKHQVLLQIGKTATETHGMLVQVYGREAVSRKCVYEWFKCFREGKETIEDEPRSGRPSTSRTPEMIEKERQMLAQDRRLTLRLIAEELDISKDTVHTIIRDDLGKRKICSRFVPHKLTDEQKAKRMETSGGFISMCDQDPLLLKTIVTGDETWCYQFDPESKRQSMSWCSPTTPRPKKNRLQKSKVKTLLIAFFDNNGIIHKAFVPAGQTFNAAFYQSVLNRLLQCIRRVRPQLHRTGKWMLIHDNAPAHCAIRVRQFLAQKMVTVLEHPPYSPDLAAFKRGNRKKSAGARSGEYGGCSRTVTIF
ncbi:hypothetical protein ANN_19959 [Periplaneta americana]|uniref:Transposase n=1 Tax=Periplaneta americana TaxID=6978 RepID=A0ABQ8SCE7_PERAM|nr:hypothetical protein ANN_19959 [Periplaneta americana]